MRRRLEEVGFVAAAVFACRSRHAHSTLICNLLLLVPPLYSSNFRLVSDYYRQDRSKILINPLSDQIDLVTKNQNVYSLTPDRDVLIDSLVFFFKDKIKNADNIILLGLKKESDKLNNIKSYLALDSIDCNIKLLDYKSFNLSSINHLFESGMNVVVVPSKDESFGVTNYDIDACVER